MLACVGKEQIKQRFTRPLHVFKDIPQGRVLANLGARHGLNFVQSASEPASAARLTVRVAGSLFVAFMPLPQRSILLGLEGPLSPPSHSLHPIVQPTENHKQV